MTQDWGPGGAKASLQAPKKRHPGHNRCGNAAHARLRSAQQGLFLPVDRDPLVRK